MIRKSAWLFAAFVLTLTAATTSSFGQDTGAPQDDTNDETLAKSVETAEKKERRFAVYVEAMFGDSASDPIESSIQTSALSRADSFLTLTDNVTGRAAVGWKLPENKGSFIVRLRGYKEDGYEFTSIGSQARVPNQSLLASSQLRWFSVNASNGRFQSVKSFPFWDPATSDTDGDGVPDADEVDYSVIPLETVNQAAPENLQNRLQAVDAVYERTFGGRRTNAAWSVGLRYFIYEGAVPAAAWLNEVSNGIGFTDGSFLRLISFNQESSGLGPTAHVEIRENFFRDRLTLYGLARTAFVLQSLDSDTGDFFTLVRVPVLNIFLSAPARLIESRDKSSWHLSGEIGARVKLAEGLHLHLLYELASYQDTILLPTSISIPPTSSQIPQGTVGLFGTQDYVVDGWMAGLSFQF